MLRVRAGQDWRAITELLLGRDVSGLPSGLEALSPPQIDIAHDIVQRLGIGPWLAGRCAAIAPAGPQSAAFLSWVADLRGFNEQRMRLWDMHRVRILDAMDSVKVDVLALKSAVLVPSCWADPAERPTADLDLLVRPADYERAHGVLAALGFKIVDSTGRKRDYMPADAQPVNTNLPGEHPSHPICIELLVHVDHDAATLKVPLTPMLWASARRNEHGRLALPLDAVVLHVAVHAARHASVRTCRFVNILDLAAAARALDASVWEKCAVTARSLGVSRLVYGALVMAERYAGATFPAAAMSRLMEDTPERVRRWVSTCDFIDWYGDPRGVLLTARVAAHTHWGGSTREQIIGAWRVLVPSRRNREADAPTDRGAVASRFVAARLGHWWVRERARWRARLGGDG